MFAFIVLATVAGLVTGDHVNLQGTLTLFNRGRIATPMTYGHITMVVEKAEILKSIGDHRVAIETACEHLTAIDHQKGKKNTFHVTNELRKADERAELALNTLFPGDNKLQAFAAFSIVSLGLGIYNTIEIAENRNNIYNQGLDIAKNRNAIEKLNATVATALQALSKEHGWKAVKESLKAYFRDIEQIEEVTLSLFEGKVPAQVVNLVELEASYKNVTDYAKDQGLQAVSLTEALRLQPTIFTSGQELRIGFAIPLHQRLRQLMTLDQPAVIRINDTFYEVRGESSHVAVGETDLVFVDSLAECDKVQDVYFCPHEKIAVDINYPTCFGAIYRRDPKKMARFCHLQEVPIPPTVFQTRRGFYHFLSGSDVTVSCSNGTRVNYHNLVKEIQVPKGCDATDGQSVVSELKDVRFVIHGHWMNVTHLLAEDDDPELWAKISGLLPTQADLPPLHKVVNLVNHFATLALGIFIILVVILVCWRMCKLRKP